MTIAPLSQCALQLTCCQSSAAWFWRGLQKVSPYSNRGSRDGQEYGRKYRNRATLELPCRISQESITSYLPVSWVWPPRSPRRLFRLRLPPVLPVYDQPPCPEDGYLWVPGYWAYEDDDYYWVPGVWVEPPRSGDILWTPGYWAFTDGGYNWHGGYWGLHVGYYGGINYGYGYQGSGFYGGRWEGNSFHYMTPRFGG